MDDYLKASDEQVDRLIEMALVEDTGQGDVTSESLIPPALRGKASITAKADGILAGIEVARKVLLKVDPSLDVNTLITDGSTVKPGDVLATVSGSVISILKAERVVLNFLQRLSGIATLAARYVREIDGLPAMIVDTRKTTPGFRPLEKYAVLMGGAQNHRLHLGDAILIKDNHLAALRTLGMSFKDIIARARQNAPAGIRLEVEVTSVAEAKEAAAAGADMILLDNMSAAEMQQAVSQLPKGVKTEASGGINLENVRKAAEAGVDIISVGALTHSPQALDISLKLDPDSIELS